MKTNWDHHVRMGNDAKQKEEKGNHQQLLEASSPLHPYASGCLMHTSMQLNKFNQG